MQIPMAPPIEDTLKAFKEGQAQINQSNHTIMLELKTSVEEIKARLNAREGMLPAQPVPNPKTQCEISVPSSSNQHMEHAKAITTLRSGKIIEKSDPVKVSTPNDPVSSKEDDGPSTAMNEKEPLKEYRPVAPFPQRLIPAKPQDKYQEYLEVFKQVKINILLLDAIKQIPSYAKFLKDLCTVKRKINV